MKKILFLSLVLLCTLSVKSQFTEFTSVPSWKGDFAVGDIDDDGDLDIIFSSGDGSEIGAILINDGAGNFTLQEGERIIKMGNAGNIQFGDIDGDGDLDVIFGGWGATGASRGIALNDGNGNYILADPEKYPISEAGTITSVGFADFNLDGLLDYYFFGNNKFNEIYLQQADGSFQKSEGAFPDLNFTEPEVTIIDFDNDGDPDIFISAWSNDAETEGRYTALFKNDGTGRFTREDGVVIYRQKANGTTSWGDVDGDGYLDFLLNGDGSPQSGEDNNQIWRLYKNENGNSVSVAHDFGEVARQGSVGNGSYIVDWDNDGKLDIILGGWSDGRGTQVTDLYLGIDPAHFTFSTYQNIGSDTPGVSEQGFRIADLDGDNKVDLLLTGYGSIGRRVTGWAKNNSENASVVPEAPGNLNATVSENNVTFTWTAPESENGRYGTTYNFSLRNTTTGKWLYNPMAIVGGERNGWRKVAGRMGNVFLNKEFSLTLPDGEYEWTVQAINGAYLGGSFAATRTFTVGEGQGTFVQDASIINPDIFVKDNMLIVKADQAQEMVITVFTVNGSKILEKTFTGKMEVILDQQGAYLVEVRHGATTPYRTKVIRQ